MTYVDSATIGCLMDLYRQVHHAGGHLKLSGVQSRVETMLTLTGAQNFIEIHADGRRREQLRDSTMRTIKTTTGAMIALDGDLLAIMEALYQEITAKRDFDRSFEDMVKEINHLHRTDGRRGAAHLPGRKPVPQHGQIRERQARRVHAKLSEEIVTSDS